MSERHFDRDRRDRRELKRETIRAECATRGIRIERRERCYVLLGDGIDVMVADLAEIDPRDLVPSPYL